MSTTPCRCTARQARASSRTTSGGATLDRSRTRCSTGLGTTRPPGDGALLQLPDHRSRGGFPLTRGCPAGRRFHALADHAWEGACRTEPRDGTYHRPQPAEAGEDLQARQKTKRLRAGWDHEYLLKVLGDSMRSPCRGHGSRESVPHRVGLTSRVPKKRVRFKRSLQNSNGLAHLPPPGTTRRYARDGTPCRKAMLLERPNPDGPHLSMSHCGSQGPAESLPFAG